MKIIKSLQNAYIKEIASLKEKKYRDIKKEFIIEGEHLVRMALASNKLKTLIITEDEIKNYSEYLDKYETLIVSEAIIKKLSLSKSPQNVLGVAFKNEDKDIEGNKLLLLDKIQDPGNLGSILRSALAFNMDGVILSRDSVDLYNDKVIRSSQGAIFEIDVYIKDLESVYKKLKQSDYQIIVSTLSDDSIDLEELSVPKKLVLVLGNEGNGVSKLSLDNSDTKVKISMSNKIDSLNVGVAGAIIMYKIYKEYNNGY